MSEITTDFDSWLDLAQPNNPEEVSALYEAVDTVSDYGLFKCSVNNEKYFVTASHVDETLMLASMKARIAFLKFITDKYVTDGFGDVHSWSMFHRAMAKDD